MPGSRNASRRRPLAASRSGPEIACLGSTSPYLALLDEWANNLGKRLALLSARNTEEFRRAEFFDADPVLASLWYGAYAQLYNSGVVHDEVCASLRQALRRRRRPARRATRPARAYFASTYSGQDGERAVKQVINASLRRLITAPRASGQEPARPAEDRRHHRQLVAGPLRLPNQPRPLVEALDGYDLTLVTLGHGGSFDTGPFREVLAVETRPDGTVDVRPLLDNSFGVVYYPDIGLKPASLLLSNLRAGHRTDDVHGPPGEHLGVGDRLLRLRFRG